MLVRALRAGGIPASAISLLPGEGDAAPRLVAHPGVTIAFTGSMPVGVEIARAAAESRPGSGIEARGVGAGTRTAVVDSDADLYEVCRESCPRRSSTPARCSAAARVLVDEAIADQLIERVAGATSVSVGQGHQSETTCRR